MAEYYFYEIILIGLFLGVINIVYYRFINKYKWKRSFKYGGYAMILYIILILFFDLFNWLDIVNINFV